MRSRAVRRGRRRPGRRARRLLALASAAPALAAALPAASRTNGRLRRPGANRPPSLLPRRPRLRRREAGGSSSTTASTTPTPEVFADLAPRSTTPATAACSAWRSIPDFPTQALRLRPLHLRPHPRRLGPGAHAGAPRKRAAIPVRTGKGADACLVSGRLVRLDRRKATTPSTTAGGAAGGRPGRRLVPAVLLALDRRPRSSAPKARSTPAAATAPASAIADYRPARARPPNPCGDPPGEGRRADAAQDAAQAACATRPASTARSSASTPTPAKAWPGNPLAASADAERAADRRLRLPQPLPLRDRSRHAARSTSATSAGTSSRRSTASTAPPATAYNSGWPCYEGPDAPARPTRTLDLDICEDLYAEPGVDLAAVLLLQPRAGGRPRTNALPRIRGSAISGSPSTRAGPSAASTTARSSSPTRCAAAST